MNSTIEFLKKQIKEVQEKEGDLNPTISNTVEKLRLVGYDPEDQSINPIGMELYVFSTNLDVIKDGVLRVQIKNNIIEFDKQQKEMVKTLFDIFNNEELKKSPDAIVDELKKYEIKLLDFENKFKGVDEIINQAVNKSLIERTTSNRLTKKIKDIDVSQGSKEIEDVQNPGKYLTVKVDKNNTLVYKKQLIALGRKMAMEESKFTPFRNYLVQRRINAMKISDNEKLIIRKAYSRHNRKGSPLGLVTTGKEIIADHYYSLRDRAAKKIGGLGLKILKGADRVPVLTYRKIFRRNKNRPTKGIVELTGKLIGDRIGRLFDRINTARKAVNTFARLRGSQLTGIGQGGRVDNAIGGVRKFAGIVGNTAKAAAGGSRVGLGVGLMVGLALGSTPIGIGIGIGAGVVATGANYYANRVMTNAVKTAGTSFIQTPRPVMGVRALNTASSGMFYGSIVGSFFGPVGTIVGGVTGAGIFAGAKFTSDLIRNATVARTGSIASVLGNIPMNQIQGQISGNLWLQSFTRVNLEKLNILQNKGTAVSESDRLFDIYSDNKLRAALAAALNATNAYMYFGSSFLVGSWISGQFSGTARWASVGLSSNFLIRGANILNVVGSRLGVIGVPLRYGSWKLASWGINSAKFGGVAFSGGIFLGTIIGIVIASVLGLNLGIGAAIGGFLGGVAGGFAGSAFGPVGTFVGAAGGSAAGTVAGAMVDTYIFGKVPRLMNPLLLLQGIMDVLKFFNTPIRSLSDYATIGMAAIGIVNFFVAITYFTGSPSVQNSSKKDDKQQQTESHVIYTGAQAGFDASYKKLELNNQNKDIYTFENFEEINELANNQIVIKDNGKYWLIKNPGKYVYNEDKKTLVGKSQNVTAEIFTTNPEIYASIDVKNDTTKTTSKVLGESTASSSGDKQLHQLSFCQVYLNLCNE